MKIRYLHHSGFAVYTDSATLVFDYFSPPSHSRHFKGDADPLPDDVFENTAVPVYVFASHVHPDHFSPEILRLKERHPDVRLMLSFDILNAGKAGITDGTFFAPYGKYDDGTVYVCAYDSTDAGVSFYVNVGGVRIFHAGDLNNWHWADESTPEEIAQAERDYAAALNALSAERPELDIAFFPVDARMGSSHDKGARQFLDAVEVRHFFPMHFWEDYAVAASFIPECEARGAVCHAPTRKGEVFDIAIDQEVS